MLKSEEPKIRMLQNHGYYLNESIHCWVKEYPFGNGAVYKTFINKHVAYEASEFEVFAMIKHNEKHAKQYVRQSLQTY